MSRPAPFLFCRYSLKIEEEVLDAAGTLAALNSVQGRFLATGPKEEREGTASIVVMRPRRVKLEGEQVVTWAIGHRPGHRTVTDYDADAQEIKFAVEGDTHILHTSLIAIPRIGAMAVSDRVSSLYMGGRPALSRTRSAFRQVEGASFSYWFLEPGDIADIVSELDLLEYAYTVRRINPTAPGALSAALDASMAKEGIGIQRGIVKPMPGGAMHADEGLIEATAELAGAGYGVTGFKGHTPAGHLAQIRKPPFSLEKQENLKQQEKEQPLRVLFEADQDDDALLASVVRELVRFYDPDDAPDVHQEPA